MLVPDVTSHYNVDYIDPNLTSLLTFTLSPSTHLISMLLLTTEDGKSAKDRKGVSGKSGHRKKHEDQKAPAMVASPKEEDDGVKKEEEEIEECPYARPGIHCIV